MPYSKPSSLLSLTLTRTKSYNMTPITHAPCSHNSSIRHMPLGQRSRSASVAGPAAGQSRRPLSISPPHASTRYFSNAVATPQNRNVFADNILKTYRLYDLDGIDIDWEYPGQVGQQGNNKSPTDSINMLEFFKDLRQKLPPGAMISAAVQDSPFAGPDGQPMKDVSAFAKVVNWITLMNYDTYGSTLISPMPFTHTWSHLTLTLARQPPGPNAPLSDGCGNSSQPNQNAVAALESWTSAGFPASQIRLGVPAYGYIVESYSRRLYTRSTSRAYSDDDSAQIQFQSLVNQGILTQYSDGSFRGSSGFTREWDTCSSTPFLRSESAGQTIPYDDNESLGIKAAWAREVKLGGLNLFDIHGDTPDHHLVRALRANFLPSPTQSTPLPSAMPSSSSAVALSPNTIPSSASEHPSSITQHSPVPLSTALPGAIVLFPDGS